MKKIRLSEKDLEEFKSWHWQTQYMFSLIIDVIETGEEKEDEN